MKTFTCETQAVEYLNKLNFSFVEEISHKETRAKIYRKGRLRALLKTEFGFLNKHSMDMGTLYVLNTWQY